MRLRTVTLVNRLGLPPKRYNGTWWSLYRAVDLCADMHRLKGLRAHMHNGLLNKCSFNMVRINRWVEGESPPCQAKMFVKRLFSCVLF